MKKSCLVLMLVLCVALVLGSTGCGGAATTTTAAAAATTTTTAATTTTVAATTTTTAATTTTTAATTTTTSEALETTDEYAGVYTREGNATDYLELRADGTFTTLDGDMTLTGTYTVNGTRIRLEAPIGESEQTASATGTIEGGRITIDGQDEPWIKTADAL